MIIDGFIAGVPVIASGLAYNGELVEPGRTGASVQPRSRDDLVRAIATYVDNPALITAMRRHCIEHARTFHIDHALRGLLRDLQAAPPQAPEPLQSPPRTRTATPAE